jgi:hypothetical protein
VKSGNWLKEALHAALLLVSGHVTLSVSLVLTMHESSVLLSGFIVGN